MNIFEEMDVKSVALFATAFVTLITAVTALAVSSYKDKKQKIRDDLIRREQQEREDRIRQELQNREDSLREEQRQREENNLRRERTHQPRIEFRVDCNFYGPVEEFYLTEVLLVVENKGRIQQKFRKIILRLRGIECGKPLTELNGKEPRLNFPIKIVADAPVVPKGIDHFFVEPGGRQVFTYVTRVPASIRYILAFSSFWYDEHVSHDSERVFPVEERVN